MPFLNLKEGEAEIAPCLNQDTIETVKNSMEGFTNPKAEEVKASCKAQGMLGHPTDCKFPGITRLNMISNCSVTENAINNANLIFGSDIAGVRGKTVGRPPKPVHIKYVQILRMILDWHQIVMLAVDCMFVHGVPFLVRVSRGLNLITAKHTPSRTAKNLAAGISHIMGLYAKGSFQVGIVLLDNKLESLPTLAPIIAMNTTASHKHILKIKRRMRLMKEYGRSILNTLPNKKIP